VGTAKFQSADEVVDHCSLSRVAKQRLLLGKVDAALREVGDKQGNELEKLDPNRWRDLLGMMVATGLVLR